MMRYFYSALCVGMINMTMVWVGYAQSITLDLNSPIPLPEQFATARTLLAPQLSGSNKTGTIILKMDIYTLLKNTPNTSGAWEKNILDSINRARVGHKLKPLIYDPVLSTIARNYARQMWQQQYFSHRDKLGRDAWYRLSQAKYNGGKLSRRGEVMAQADTSSASFNALVTSPKHKTILMGSGATGYNLIGIGNRKGNTVGLLFYNPRTTLKNTTFRLPGSYK